MNRNKQEDRIIKNYSGEGSGKPLNGQTESFIKGLECSRDLIKFQNKAQDYQKIAEDFLEICGGKFVACNLYEGEGRTFSTKAIAGDPHQIQQGLKTAGLMIGKMKWNRDEVREQRMRGRTTTVFSSLGDLTGNVLSNPMVNKTAESLNIGETAVIKIVNEDKILGDFTVFMEKGETFKNLEIAETFSNQIGMVLEKNEREKKLREKNELLLKLTGEVPGALFQFKRSPEGAFWCAFVSEGVREVCEVTPKEVMEDSQVVFSHIHPDDYQRIMGTIEKSATELSLWDVEYRVILPTKGQRWLKGSARPEMLSDGSVQWYGYINDFTENVERQKKIEYLSMHDDLTGLYNRRYLEAAEKNLDREENLPLACFYLDVNGLKLNNDAFGHSKGDQLLSLVGKILKDNCRGQDVVARTGGDEFNILLPRTGKAQAALVANRIHQEFAKAKLEPAIVSVAMGFAVKTGVQQELNDIKAMAEKRMYKNKRKGGKAMRNETIAMITQSMEEKHQKEEIHSLKVGIYTEKIAKALDFNPEAMENIKRTALLHDIGKVMVPPELLNKPDKLTKEEYEIVQQHSEIGYQILKSLEEYRDMAEIILYHHERWDGKGYPQGLKEKEIPLGSRIINIADAYEAMTGQRPYREPKSKEAAIKELIRCSGTQFDPELVQIFIREITDFPE